MGVNVFVYKLTRESLLPVHNHRYRYHITSAALANRTGDNKGGIAGTPYFFCPLSKSRPKIDAEEIFPLSAF